MWWPLDEAHRPSIPPRLIPQCPQQGLCWAEAGVGKSVPLCPVDDRDPTPWAFPSMPRWQGLLGGGDLGGARPGPTPGATLCLGDFTGEEGVSWTWVEKAVCPLLLCGGHVCDVQCVCVCPHPVVFAVCLLSWAPHLPPCSPCWLKCFGNLHYVCACRRLEC